MSDNMISALDNPALANQMVNQALTQVTVGVPEELAPASLPPESTVQLCGGLHDIVGGTVELDAEVRELNGADEEALSRIMSPGKTLLTVLQRGTTHIGGKQATPDMLDDLLSGDRELLLLAIRKATFGPEVELEGMCPLCNAPDVKFEIDLDKDVEVRRLEDPIMDRHFSVQGKAGTFQVTLPTGHTQKKLINANDKTSAELDTILLKDCILSINDMPVMDANQIKRLSIQDRRKVMKEILDRTPGPQLSDIKKSCSACGQEVPLPLTLADLFRI